MDACSGPGGRLLRDSGWVLWRRTLTFPHSAVSADTEVVGGDGQHDPHLGAASRLLLPASHLHQPYRLQVSALGSGSVPHSCSFSLLSHLATSYVSSLERALFPFSGGNVLEVGGGCTAFSLSLYAIFLLFRPWLWRRATPLSLCTVCGNLSLGLSQEPLYFLLCVLPLTAGSQRRSPHRRTLSLMWTAASTEQALLGE